MIATLAELVHVDGYGIARGVVDDRLCEILRQAVTGVIPGNKRAGTRSLLAVPAIRELATSGAAFELVTRVLGHGARPVRGILFDKQPGANWDLGWHQDRAIAVREKRDAPGFVGWSIKEGVTHVLPPAFVLEEMLAVRIHLDDCGLDNGPLRVSPGTHRHGLIEKSQMRRQVEDHGETVCPCQVGDVLIMRPLLLHASSASVAPCHRRVVHIEYAACDLPFGLEWFA